MQRSPTTLLTAAGRQTLQTFLERHVAHRDRFSTEISPEDEMYLHQRLLSNGDVDDAILRYFDSGRLMLSEYRPLIDAAFGSIAEVDSILEFACGHGRFTRYLLQEVEPERVWASDIYTDAVDFQRKQFGVSGIPSVADPDAFVSDRAFQLILVSSLFSHLPADTFSRWLARLGELLTEDGVLIFSVHDAQVLPTGLSIGEDGIRFDAVSESRSLDKNQYGTTFVDETFVRRAISKAMPGTGGYVRIKQGLWRYQDLYVVSKGGRRDLGSVGKDRGPRGYLDRFGVDEARNRILLRGWAHDLDAHQVADRVEVYAANRKVATCKPDQPRPDVAQHFDDASMTECGWTCEIDRAELSDSELLSIEAFDASGRKFVLECNTVAALREQVSGRTPAND